MNRKLLKILSDIHKKSLSGVLRIKKGTGKKQLVLNKGSLVFAESNLPELHLARIMVKLGLLPKAKTKEIASLMKEGKTSEEAILALSPSGMEGLGKGRYEQAILVMASLWKWDDCEAQLYPGEGLVRYRLNLYLPLPELIVDSVRRAVSDRLLSIPSNFLERYYRIVEDAADSVPDLPLNSVESYAYSLMQEPMKAAELLPLLPASEEKPEELLFRLFVLGLIAQKEPAGKSYKAADIGSLSSQLDDMLMRFETDSLYEILSAPADASPDQIQAAYYDLAKQLHPDRFQSGDFPENIRLKAEKVFSSINEAYVTLRNPNSRALYDETRLAKESKVEAELKARGGSKSEDEKTAAALFREGRSLLAGGNFEKAVERLKGSVWLYPEKAVYHHYLGVALSEIPKLRKSAEQHLLKALELDKTSADSRLELAKLYIKVSLPRRAEQQLQEFMRWDPENIKALEILKELKKLPSK
jgi:curved DNA-binding protein CbpA